MNNYEDYEEKEPHRKPPRKKQQTAKPDPKDPAKPAPKVKKNQIRWG